MKVKEQGLEVELAVRALRAGHEPYVVGYPPEQAGRVVQCACGRAFVNDRRGRRRWRRHLLFRLAAGD